MTKRNNRPVGSTITIEETEEIVRMKLDGVPVRDIGEHVGVNKDTVTRVWRDWLDETRPERRAELEQQRTILIGRLWRLADRARASEAACTDADVARKWAAEERQALRAVSTVCGFDAPIKLQTSTFEVRSEAEAAAALKKL